MDKSIEYIHNNKLAILNKKYFGKDGTVYIGLPNKRLKVFTSPVQPIIQTTNVSNSTNTLIKEVEIDFGSFPIRSKKFTIIDSSITSTSNVIVSSSGNVATGRVGDDYEWDSINFSAKPNTGTFTLTAYASGRIRGKRKILYSWQ